MAENVRIEAYFSGHVQGVGFRFTSIDIAERFPEIAGFVRNLADGRVEVVAEGPEEQVGAFHRGRGRRDGTVYPQGGQEPAPRHRRILRFHRSPVADRAPRRTAAQIQDVHIMNSHVHSMNATCPRSAEWRSGDQAFII